MPEQLYNMNIDTIRRHMEWQEHIESTEDGLPATYNYNEQDVNIALPVMAQGLKDLNFKTLDDSTFNQKIISIFGDIFHSSNTKVKIHPHFYTVFEHGANEEEDEFDYTIENLFISKEYKFITWVPFMGDFVKFTDKDHYKIDLHPRMVALNKYLFNSSQSDLAYLLQDNTFDSKGLIKSFGYTKEPKINDLVMKDYLDLDDNHIATVGEIIFIKNAAGALEIKEELLKWIVGHTHENDNRLLNGLEYYADALYDSSYAQIFTHQPFHTFTLNEKRKIIAYIATVYEPLYYKFSSANKASWPVSSVLEYMLTKDKGLEAYLRQHKYFSLPGLRNAMESADGNH